MEQPEKLLFFAGSYLLPGWHTVTDGCETDDREGNVLLGPFSVEKARFKLASAEGAFRQCIHIAVRLEQFLWPVRKAGNWPRDSEDNNCP